MKKILFLLLSSIMILFPQFAFAADEKTNAYTNKAIGSIVYTKNNIIEMEVMNNEEDIVLRINDKTRIIDCVSGVPIVLADREDNAIVAYYNYTSTINGIDEGEALVLICNVPMEIQGYIVPEYVKVDSVEKISANHIKIKDNQGPLSISIDSDTKISSYLTKNIITIDKIQAGAELMVWYDEYPTALQDLWEGKAVKVLYLEDSNIIVSDASTIIQLKIGIKEATVNGKETSLDAPPVISNGRTMLPVRFIAEELGCVVSWDDKTRTATVKSGPDTILLQIGNAQATVNGAAVQLDAPPIISNNRTLLPIRFIAEEFGCRVDWVEETRDVVIIKE